MYASAGVDHHAGGLIDGNQVAIFVEDGERDGFGRGAQGGRIGGFHFDGFAGAYGVGGAAGKTSHPDAAGADPLRKAGAAELGKPLAKQLVEPLGGVLRRRGEAERRNHASDRAPLGVEVSGSVWSSAASVASLRRS